MSNNCTEYEIKGGNNTLTRTMNASEHNDLDYANGRGLSGLTNIGNTCYMNASLQALSATVPFVSYMIHKKSSLFNDITGRIADENYMAITKDNLSNDTKELEMSTDDIKHNAKISLTYSLRVTLKHLWANNCEVTPKHLRRKIARHMKTFAKLVQHDSQEFLSAILDNVHEATKKTGVIKSYTDMKNELIQLNITTDNADNDNIVIGMFDMSYAQLEGYVECENTLIKLEQKLADATEKKILEDVRNVTTGITAIYRLNPDMYKDVKSRLVWREYLSKSYSVINDIFSGMSIKCIECDTCKNVFHNFDRHDLLTLSIPEVIDEKVNSYTLHDLFRFYIEYEKPPEAYYHCRYCGTKQFVTITHLIHHQPRILVLLIKKYHQYNKEIFKSNIKINYPHRLDITEYTTGMNPQNNNYELYSVIRHSGGYGGGHYYTYQKSPINNLWYVHDDSDVYGVSNNEPLDANGYVLFYRRC